MFSFAGQAYDLRIPPDAPPYATACVANDAARMAVLLREGVSPNREATVPAVEMDEEFEETFSLLFLSVLAGAVDVAAVLLDGGADPEDVADLTRRAYEAHPGGSPEDNTDLRVLRTVVGRSARWPVAVAPHHFVASDSEGDGLLDALLWVGCAPNSLSAPLPDPEAMRRFCHLVDALPGDALRSLAAPPCLLWAKDPDGQAPSDAAWEAGRRQSVSDAVPTVHYTDVALLLLLLRKQEGPLRSALAAAHRLRFPVAWEALLYNGHLTAWPCFQAVVEAGPEFFLVGPPPRSPELCLKVGSKTKVYDSRMEKFCEAQLPRLPPDWRRSFVAWWHQKIVAEGLIVPPSDDVVEDSPLGLEVIGRLFAADAAPPLGSSDAAAMSLETRFAASAEAVKGLRHLTDDQKLLLYGLYKQATVGDCDAPSPGMFDFVGKAKWRAWDALRGIPRDDAMRRYIALATQPST